MSHFCWPSWNHKLQINFHYVNPGKFPAVYHVKNKREITGKNIYIGLCSQFLTWNFPGDRSIFFPSDMILHGLRDCFRTGAGYEKDQTAVRRLELSTRSPSSRKGRGIRKWVNDQWSIVPIWKTSIKAPQTIRFRELLGCWTNGIFPRECM